MTHDTARTTLRLFHAHPLGRPNFGLARGYSRFSRSARDRAALTFTAGRLSMQQILEGPTPQALADLVARCEQINRYATQLTAAEEGRIAALAAGILVMRQVLDLQPIAPEHLPARQARIEHWALAGGHLAAAEAPPIHRLRGLLVLDEHEQVKILSQRTWRGVWREVTLWRDGVQGLHSVDVMAHLARLTALAQDRAPNVARGLLARAEAVAQTHASTPAYPRSRG